EDQSIREHLLHSVLQVQLRDNVKARQLCPDGSYQKCSADTDDQQFNSQEWLLNHWKDRSKNDQVEKLVRTAFPNK
ncbi:MAG: hypothetical protein JSU59_01690, partial [Nitrospirota bacterium]